MQRHKKGGHFVCTGLLMHTQTHTELSVFCLRATILWHNVGPIPVTGVDGQTNTHTCLQPHTSCHIHTSSWVCSCFSAQQQSLKETMGSNAIAVRTPYTVLRKVSFSLTFSSPHLYLAFCSHFICSFSQMFFWGFTEHALILGGLCLWTWQWWGVKTFGFYRANKAGNGCKENELNTL